jgi:hypothetical protein
MPNLWSSVAMRGSLSWVFELTPRPTPAKKLSKCPLTRASPVKASFHGSPAKGMPPPTLRVKLYLSGVSQANIPARRKP